MAKEFDHMYKFVLMGNAGVGKSSLVLQFSETKFQANYITTIGVDFKIRILNLDGERYKLHVWDTAGQERFKTIVTTYYRGAQGVLIVYDVTNQDSFLDVNSWLHEVHQNCSGAAITIVGNKCDKTDEQVIKTECGEEFAREHGLHFFETSAKENINVNQDVVRLEKSVIARVEDNEKWKTLKQQKKLFEELTRQVKKIESEAKSMDISDFTAITPGDESENTMKSKCC